MQTRHTQPTTDSTSKVEVNPAWVAFFSEAMRLAELARQRRAEREATELVEEHSKAERSEVSEAT